VETSAGRESYRGATDPQREAIMAATRTAQAHWKGNLLEGEGTVDLVSSGLLTGAGVSWPSRTEESNGKTSPEELIAAAHAACFSMAFSKQLDDRGAAPDSLEVKATSTFEKTDAGFRLTKMHLDAVASAPGLEEAAFQEAAQVAKEGCPVSNALAGNVQITLDATLS
jgi:osmotically inducible protein OsmC